MIIIDIVIRIESQALQVGLRSIKTKKEMKQKNEMDSSKGNHSPVA